MKILLLLLLTTLTAQAQMFTFGTGKQPGTPTPPVTDGFHVDQANVSASDSNPCTSGSPCLTVQRGINVTPAGSTLWIHAGTYREAITPPNSGSISSRITIQGMPGETVIISGLNTADGGWTVYSGDIYQRTTSMPNPTNYDEDVDGTAGNIMANQVFKGGVMMPQARYPNAGTPEDMLDKTKFRTLGNTTLFSQTQITDTGIPANINGAKVFVEGWFLSQTASVTGQSGSTITYTSLYIADPLFRKFYYLTDDLDLLDAEKEWHYQSGTLYFRQEGGGSPTGVEYKARSWAFDLSGKSYITIKDIDFIGCDPVKTTTSGSSIIVDGIVANYPNYAFIISNAGANYTRAADQCGIKILAPNSTIKNSTIAYAGAMGIWLGNNCTADNNLIHDVNWLGMFGAPFKPWSGTSGQIITRNTSYRAGRGHVELSSADCQNMDISYNDFSYHNMISVDGGAIYSQQHKNHAGSIIHHNWFYNPQVSRVGGVNGIQITGNYFDQMSGPATAHHNVHWGGDEADYYTELKNVEGTIEVTGPKLLYNETWTGPNTALSYHQSYVSYGNPASGNRDIQRNDIYLSGIDARVSTPNVANSLQRGGTAVATFLSANFVQGDINTDKGLYYRLKAGSAAIDAGLVISGITDGYIGSLPDIGAYEFGGTAWVPGCSTANGNPNCP